MAAHWQQNYQLYKKYLQNIIILYQKRQDIRVFTELLLTLAAIFTFGIFAIKPTLVTIAQLIREKNNKEKIIAVMDEKIANLTQAEIVFDQEKNRILTLNLAIPDQPLPENYIRQIEGIAKNNNVTLTSLTIANAPLIGKPQDEVPSASKIQKETKITPLPENANHLPISLRVTGDYHTLLSFLANIESMRRPFYPEETNLSLLEEGSTNLVLSISGQIVYLK
jgi:Tfp pilus assembly protein PilO